LEIKVAYLYIAVAVGLLCKHGNLPMAVAIGGLFESVLSSLTHCICHLGRAVASGVARREWPPPFEIGNPPFNC